VDEGQDLSRAMIKLVHSVGAGKMVVYSGDPNQSIYQFTGNVNVVDYLDAMKLSYKKWQLHATFRFGMDVCDFVNKRNLSSYVTVPHRGNARLTTIERVRDGETVKGPHVILGGNWKTLLDAAVRSLDAGRDVRMDAGVVTELTRCAKAGWATSKAWLFKQVPRERVLAILSRVNREGAEGGEGGVGTSSNSEGVAGDDPVFLSTVHGFKGCEHDHVRVMRCVLQRQRDSTLIYVAVTRARKTLYLPR